MSTRDHLAAFGDYMASDLSGRQFHSFSAWVCAVSSVALLVIGIVWAFTRRDPKDRYDWLDETGVRYFQFSFRFAAALGALELSRLLSFPGQLSPVVVAVMAASPYGFAVDILFDFLVGPWQRFLRASPRRCMKCRSAMTLKESGGSEGFGPHYDTWACTCGEIRVDGYGNAKPLASCPNCGFKTWETVMRPLRPSTPSSDGESILQKHCLSCHHKIEERVVVPRQRRG